MPKQGVLGGSIIMPSVFQNSFNIKDPSIMPSNSAYVASVLVLLDCDCGFIFVSGAKSTCQMLSVKLALF